MNEQPRSEREWMKHCADLQKQYKFDDLLADRTDRGKTGQIGAKQSGNIPVLFANGTGLAETYENALINLWVNGGFLRTQYDRADATSGLFIDPPSKDTTMHLVVDQPFAEPMIHKAFPGGLEDLEEYRQEVVDGIKDNWVRNPDDPTDTRWEYTYHGRFADYRVPGIPGTINQIQEAINNLVKSPITRRSQMITWKPWEDVKIGDPACLQSFWFRIMRETPEGLLVPEGVNYSDEKIGKARLNTNIRIRSNDAFGAHFMNMFGFIHLAQYVADEVAKKREEPVQLGRIDYQADSFHVYGKDFPQFLERFGNSLRTRNFSRLPGETDDSGARTMYYNDPETQSMFAEARPVIARKVAEQNAKYA